MRLNPIRFIYLLAVLGLVMLPTACRDATGLENGSISAVPTEAGILVSNHENFSVQVYSIAEDELPLWDTVQCIQGSKVPAGEARTFSWAQIYGYAPARSRYRTMWWREGACSFGSDGNPRGRLLVTR